MKVDVVQVSDIKFKWYSLWSDWIDVAVFDYASSAHLLQMKVSRTNKKRFRSPEIKGSSILFHASPTVQQMGDLTPMKRATESES